MANLTNLTIRRIPLVFVLDAANNSRVGKLFDRMAGGLGVNSIGLISDAASAIPGASAGLSTLSKIPGLGAAGKVLGSLKNKIILPMLVNPSTLDVTKNPTIVKKLTKKGIVNQYYLAQPDSITFSGIAGGQRSFLILSQLDTLIKTTEDGTRNIVTLIYKYGGVYKGIIENFKITTNADNPNIFNYSFDFNFVDRTHFRLFLLAIRPGSLNEAIQNPGKVFKETLKLSAKELVNNTGLSLGKSRI